MTCNATTFGSLSSGGILAAKRATVIHIGRKGLRHSDGARAETAQDTEVSPAGGDAPFSSASSTSTYKIPEPKKFFVRSDKFLDIAGGALNFPFRLGTGAFVSGYALLTDSLHLRIWQQFP